MLKKALGATEDDTLVLVWGNRQDARTGALEIAIRAKEATIGIPSETRQALRDGTNGFERILPGPDRMYPDTDLPPRPIARPHLEMISKSVPRPFYEKVQWYRELGVPADVQVALSISPFSDLFALAVREWGIAPTLAAVILIQFPKRVTRLIGKRVVFSEQSMRELLLALREKRLSREGVLPVMVGIASGHGFSRQSLPPQCTEAELSQAIEDSINEVSGMEVRHPEKYQEILMGSLMQRVRGRTEGARVAERLTRQTSEVRR